MKKALLSIPPPLSSFWPHSYYWIGRYRTPNDYLHTILPPLLLFPCFFISILLSSSSLFPIASLTLPLWPSSQLVTVSPCHPAKPSTQKHNSANSQAQMRSYKEQATSNMTLFTPPPSSIHSTHSLMTSHSWVIKREFLTTWSVFNTRFAKNTHKSVSRTRDTQQREGECELALSLGVWTMNTQITHSCLTTHDDAMFTCHPRHAFTIHPWHAYYYSFPPPLSLSLMGIAIGIDKGGEREREYKEGGRGRRE